MIKSREIKFMSPPDGMPSEGCFEIVARDMHSPADGEVLVATHFLSIDPYMRRAMGGARKQYQLTPGATMIGRGAGVVIESRHPEFQEGDAVQSEFGWREHVVLKGDGLRKLAPDLQPLSNSLGIVGQKGETANLGQI